MLWMMQQETIIIMSIIHFFVIVYQSVKSNLPTQSSLAFVKCCLNKVLRGASCSKSQIWRPDLTVLDWWDGSVFQSWGTTTRKLRTITHSPSAWHNHVLQLADGI